MNNIKQIRKSCKMSVTELAQKLNMSQGNLTKIENGIVELKPELANKIASILHVTPSEITSTHDKMQSDGVLKLLNPEAVSFQRFSELKLPYFLLQTDGISKTLFVMPDNSMQPTIAKNNIVVVDVDKNTYNGDGLYLLKYGEEFLLRRLQNMLNGTIGVLADNANCCPIILQQTNCEIYGKAISVIKEQAL